MSEYSSYITNSYIALRNPEDCLVRVTDKMPAGLVEITIDRYAIIPIEDYNALLVSAGKPPVITQEISDE